MSLESPDQAMLYPLLYSPLQPLLRTAFERGPSGLDQQIAQLFRAGEMGVWYDPSDMSTMWQDAAQTTRAVIGSPVGYISDKSGNGFAATQAVAGSRPTLQQTNGLNYLQFDGADDYLVTGGIDFSSTDKMSVWAGMLKSSDAATGIVFELSAAVALNPGAFSFAAPSGATPTISGILNSTAQGSVTLSGIAAPANMVITVQYDIAQAAPGTETTLRVNGAITAPTPGGSAGTGNFGAYPLYIGRRGGTTNPFNGRLNGLIVRGAASTATQVQTGETYMNQKTGAF